MNIALKKAKGWAERIWLKVITSWSERSTQDYAYRKYVVEPSLNKLINQLNLNITSSIVEIGCGDGAHTIFWRQQLNSLGFGSTPILGIDWLEPLIIRARKRTTTYNNLYFEIGDVTNINTANLIHDKVGNPKIVVAMFVLQDVPDLEGVMRTVSSALKKDGHFIAVFVHPDFAEHLLKQGHLKQLEDMEENIPSEYISSSKVVQWRFVAYYPIVQEDRLPFYTPYFHRYLTDYYKAFENFGLRIEKEIPLLPDSNIVSKSQKDNILPFYENKFNLYWPLIIQVPSSILIHAIKHRL